MTNCIQCGNELSNKKNKFCSYSCNSTYQAANRTINIGAETNKRKRETNIQLYLLNPKKCERCDSIIEYDKKINKFCSSSCAASTNNENRSELTDETRQKISDAVKAHYIKIGKNVTNKPIKNRSEIIKRVVNELKLTADEKLLCADFETLKFERIRKRVFLEQGKLCNCCKLNEWMGKEIPFELNHIDGDNKNNLRENLEALCPNCHAQTDTWRGRNKKSIGFSGKKVSDEQLLDSLLKFNWNMRQALIDVNVSAKGGNYKRCHFLKREYFKLFSD